MLSLIILFLGTFWEASMDILSMKHNYDRSRWKLLADYFDRKNKPGFGSAFWDNSVAWSNKWKNKDPKQGERFFGSSTVFVTFMDGWHVVKFIWLVHVFAAIVFYTSITPYIFLDLILFYLVFGIGHEVFSRILKTF